MVNAAQIIYFNVSHDGKNDFEKNMNENSFFFQIKTHYFNP